MRGLAITSLLFTCMTCVVISACRHKFLPAPDSGYPPEIEHIIVSRCAVSGCHNQASYSACDNLLLDTWDHMFQGDNSGAVVVPFSPQYSILLYFVNTDSALGPVFQPLMPYQAKTPVLSHAEYQLLADWIAKGAPDKNGNIPFGADAANRQKIYASMQDGMTGIDLIAVIDAKSKVIMRFLQVGINPAGLPESVHSVKCSNDGANAYLAFYNSSVVQKLNTTTDQIAGSAYIGGGGNWSGLCIDSANTTLLVTGFTNGKLPVVTTANMTVDPSRTYSGLDNPHGIVANNGFNTFYVTSQYGNTVYQLDDPGNAPVMDSIDNHAPSTTDPNGTAPDPHDIFMLPDDSKYFVSCQGSNEVRVMNTGTDSLIKAIKVGLYPQELAISRRAATPYIFVTCTQDINANVAKGNMGSVYVINYKTLEIVKVLYGDFFQPHGITVDDRDGLVYIFSTNANGVKPHHAVAGQQDGWYSVYDLNTLTPADTRRYETKTNPYSAAVRFISTH